MKKKRNSQNTQPHLQLRIFYYYNYVMEKYTLMCRSRFLLPL